MRLEFDVKYGLGEVLPFHFVAYPKLSASRSGVSSWSHRLALFRYRWTRGHRMTTSLFPKEGIQVIKARCEQRSL